jgi:hypothetical protein
MFIDSKTGWLIRVSTGALALLLFLWLLTPGKGRRGRDSVMGTTAMRQPHDSSLHQPRE